MGLLLLMLTSMLPCGLTTSAVSGMLVHVFGHSSDINSNDSDV